MVASFARSVGLALAHARELAERGQTEEALKARSREQQILLRFSQILLGLLDPEGIARAIFEVLRDHLRADGIGLRVPDAEGTHLEMIAAEGWMKEHIHHLRVPLEPLGSAARRGLCIPGRLSSGTTRVPTGPSPGPRWRKEPA